MPQLRFHNLVLGKLQLVLLEMFLFPAPSVAADWTLRAVVEVLHQTSPDNPADFSKADLSFLDLSRLDFKQAKLEAARLHAADLTDANLSNCNLRLAALDRATLIGSSFKGADLHGALIRLPHGAGSPGFDRASTPNFELADLQKARLVGRFDGGNFRFANLTDADLGPYGDWTQNTLTRRPVIISGDFSEAKLLRTNFAEAILQFAKFNNAQLTGANFSLADLTGADFSGANLTNANVTGANLEDARLNGAKGLSTLIGRARALNWPQPAHRF